MIALPDGHVGGTEGRLSPSLESSLVKRKAALNQAPHWRFASAITRDFGSLGQSAHGRQAELTRDAGAGRLKTAILCSSPEGRCHFVRLNARFLTSEAGCRGCGDGAQL